MSATPDDTILATPTVVISKTLVRIKGVAYPVNGIGSVFVRRPRIVGLVLLALGLGSMGVSDFAKGNGGLVLLLLGAGVLGYALTRPSILVLRTAGRDQKALHSRDGASLLAVKRAIEEAVRRGREPVSARSACDVPNKAARAAFAALDCRAEAGSP